MNDLKINEFARMRGLVDTLLKRYRQVRRKCDIKDDEWHSRSIEKLAASFLEGSFTLAVVGKVSAGKSTFINALLGCKDLLPTGHDQTTCGVTSIEYGEEPEATITFADDHSVVVRDDISGEIKAHVAIPEEFHNLPVNNIDEMILADWDFETIWDKREQLEKETLCSPIKADELKRYVASRNKANIAVNVRIKYPFSEELKGWRIMDTPGIGAIGGIEVQTRQLLATQRADGSREVDAIIFLQDGSQTLDQADTKKFVSELLDNFTESDRHRLFYVLTHGTSSGFRDHKDNKLRFIEENYGDKIKYVSHVDSLLCSFIELQEREQYDLKYYDDLEDQRPGGWEESEWEAVMAIMYAAKRQLKKQHDTFNHDTMFRLLQEWSNFDDLKRLVNDFAKKEKEESLNKFLELLKCDYAGFQSRLQRNQELVESDKDKISEAKEGILEKKREYNRRAQKADQRISIEKIKKEFKFIDERLREIDELKGEGEVRTAITNLFDDVQQREKEVFEEIAREYSDISKRISHKYMVWDAIDFDALENEATDFGKERYVIEPARVVSHVSSPDERIPAKYAERFNEEKKLKGFKALVVKKAGKQRDKFLKQLIKKIENMRKRILVELDKKIEAEKRAYEELEPQLKEKRKFASMNRARIKSVCDTINDLDKQVGGSGYGK